MSTTKKAYVLTTKGTAIANAAQTLAPVARDDKTVVPQEKPRGYAKYAHTNMTVNVPAGSFVIVLPSLPVKLSANGNYTLAADSGDTGEDMPGSHSPIRFTGSIWAKRVLGFALANEAQLQAERAARLAKEQERAARRNGG